MIDTDGAPMVGAAADAEPRLAACPSQAPTATVGPITIVRPTPWRAPLLALSRLGTAAGRWLPDPPAATSPPGPMNAASPEQAGSPQRAGAPCHAVAAGPAVDAGRGAGVPVTGAAPTDAGDHRHTIHLPSPVGFARHALPSLVESTIGPAVLFYLVLTLVGFRGALIAALGWSYLAAGRRMVRRQRMPGMLVLGVVLLTLRTAVSFATGSAFLYFVQPSIGTFAVAVLFVVTAALRRPLIERLAHDFCPLDAELMARPHVRSFFLRISVLWALVLLTNVGIGLFLLLETSLRAFVVERTALSVGLIAAGAVVSAVWFVRTMARVGVSVRWASVKAG